MNKSLAFGIVVLAGSLCTVFSPLHASKATLQLKDGRNLKSDKVVSETVSGIDWIQEGSRPGVRIKLWEIENVRYNGADMDSFNGLLRKLQGGRGVQLLGDANSYLKQEKPSQGFSNAEWDLLIKLSCEYFAAEAEGLNGNTDAAIKGLEAYLKKCEESPVTDGVLRNVSFASKVSGKTVSNGGGLHRYYLDALESLGKYYLKKGDAKSASDKAFKPLAELCKSLSTSSRDGEYFNWSMRALKIAALDSEAKKDFKGAREYYNLLMTTALERSGGQQNRQSREAQLMIGFMLIEEGNLSEASTQFLASTRDWERAHLSPDTIRPDRLPPPPANDWITPDVAYLAAGSYLGQGRIETSKARKSKNATDWTKAYQNYSTSMSIFMSDEGLRSQALLGAAEACAQLAELKKGKAVDASNYAKLAEKYLAELTTLYPKSKAADSSLLPEITATVKKYVK